MPLAKGGFYFFLASSRPLSEVSLHLAAYRGPVRKLGGSASGWVGLRRTLSRSPVNLRFSARLVVNAVSSKERVEPKIEVMPVQAIPRSEANRLRLAQRLAER